MVTSLSLDCSLPDRGTNLDSSSMVVIRFRKCHLQSFQFSSETWLKNLLRFSEPIVLLLLGGSSVSLIVALGGSSSVEINAFSCIVVLDCVTLRLPPFSLILFLLCKACTVVHEWHSTFFSLCITKYH